MAPLHPRPHGSRLARLAVLLALVAGLVPASIALYPTPVFAAGTIVVTTADDETNALGDCSLREAITAASTNEAVDGCPAGSAAAPDTIAFNIGGGGAQTITLGSTLPVVNGMVDIDGTTQPGYNGTPLVAISYAGTPLSLSYAMTSTVKALDLSYTGESWSGFGLEISNSQNITVTNVVVHKRRIGISVSGGRDVRLVGNDVSGSGFNGRFGIGINNVGSRLLPGGIAISDNTYGGDAHNGLSLQNMSNLTISDGSIPGSQVVLEASNGLDGLIGTALQLISVYTTTVQSVDLDYATSTVLAGTGLAIQNSGNITATHVSTGMRWTGILGSGGRDLRLIDNTLGRTGSYGIDLTNVGARVVPGGIAISGNTFGDGVITGGGVRLQTMSNLTISDGSVPGSQIVLDDSLTTAGIGLELTNVQTTTVDSLNLSYAGPSWSGWGLIASNSQNITITNVLAQNHQGGITVGGGRDVRVFGNDVRRSGFNGEFGITISAVGAQLLPGGIAISGNTYGGNAHNALRLQTMSNLTISDGSVPGSQVVLEASSGVGGANSTGLYLNDVYTTTVQSVDLGYTSASILAGTGLAIQNSGNITATHVSTGMRRTGILGSGGRDLRLVDNTLGRTMFYGINLNNIGAGVVPGGIAISGNAFGAGVLTSGGGVRLQTMSNLTISDGSVPGSQVVLDDGSLSTAGIGLELTDVQTTTVDSLNLNYAGASFGGWGVIASNSQNITITNVLAQNYQGGIGVGGGRDVRVFGNDLRRSGFNGEFAIDINNVGAQLVPGGIAVFENAYGDGGGNALRLQNMSGLTISDGSIPGSQVVLEATSGISKTTDTGLYLGNVYTTTVAGLDLSYSGPRWGTGLALVNSSNLTLERLVVKRRDRGISMSGGSGLTASCLNLQNNAYGLDISSTSGDVSLTASWLKANSMALLNQNTEATVSAENNNWDGAPAADAPNGYSGLVDATPFLSEGPDCVDAPQLSIGDASGTEGAEAGSAITMTVTLSKPATSALTVSYATADGTAKAGIDYAASSGVLTFAPGETSQTITVMTLGNKRKDGNRSFTVTLANATDALVVDGSASATIVDDEHGAYLPLVMKMN